MEMKLFRSQNPLQNFFNGLCITLLITSVSYGELIPEEDITAQRVVVKTAQAILDSLISSNVAEGMQQQVDRDSLLRANKITVQTSVIRAGSGARDPLYVSVDIPYSAWSLGEQRDWNLQLRESRLGVIDIGLGLYQVKNAETVRFLRLVKNFLQELDDIAALSR
jgi:hypothetical protein